MTYKEANMRKKLVKTAALITCFAVVLMYVPMTYAGTDFRYNFRHIDLSHEIISSIFFFLPNVNLIGFSRGLEKDSEFTNPNFRTLGEIPIHRLGEGN